MQLILKINANRRRNNFWVWIFRHFFDYRNISFWILQHLFSNTTTSQIEKLQKKYWLYSQQANYMILKKVAKFIKLIKRFWYLQLRLKSSNIWRWLSGLKWELFQTLSKVEILMFFDEQTLIINLFMFFAAYFINLLIFWVLIKRHLFD
jgi:hypothetical protein